MKIGILHGWLLDGSGSNIYVYSLSKALSERGHEAHLICQETHPERYPAVSVAYRHDRQQRPTKIVDRGGKPGFFLHTPYIDHGFMPAYNADTAYAGFTEVCAFRDIVGDPRLERYLEDFAAGVEAICRLHGLELIHANHVYPMPEVARRVKRRLGVPYLVYPHGSAIEYAVKEAPQYKVCAEQGIDEADALIVGNQIVSERLWKLYPGKAAAWKKKHGIVSVGVDCELFEPVAPGARAAEAARLLAQDRPGGGKTAAMTAALLARDMGSDAALLSAVREARVGYEHKAPDADLAARLRGVDWGRAKIMVFAGKIIAPKGLQDLFCALPLILERHPETILFVAGEGPYRETLEVMLHALSAGERPLLERIVRMGWDLDRGPARPLEKIQAFLGKTGWDRLLAGGKRTRPSEHVVFTGYLKHSIFRHLLPCADLAVFPSEVAEAYPLVLLESISAGVLPAASYFEGLGEGLDTIGAQLGGDIGPLMRFDMQTDRRVASMADNIGELLSRKPVWREKCRSLASEVYSWAAVAAEMETVYSRLAKSAKSV